ncbi:MAG: FAD-dependent oxidoreductase [Promethearchaeota archaeon]
MTTTEKVFETDVLIIGSGGAGLIAAIKAHDRNVKVLIVSKSKLTSGCTAWAMGGMQAAYDPRDSQDIHFNDTVKGSAYLSNQHLARTMVAEAMERVHDLESYGTIFIKEDGKFKLFPFSGCSFARAVISTDPYAGGFVKGLIEEVKRRGIEFIENTMITTLMTKNNKVIGALGINEQTGDLLVFNAKSTILATGGAGHLYPLTTNPSILTGDGYAMAYRAGAELMDMEFIQTRVCIIQPSGLRGQPPPSDGLVTIGGRFYNAYGERFMKKYYPDRVEDVTRAEMSLAAFKEIKRGAATANGGVYNDLSGVAEDDLKRFTKFMNACETEGIDPTWQPIEWAPGVHHFMGGIKINEKCETNLPGLFAAGEVTGGIHGANRMGGNALTDVIVFGARAGIYAAERALTGDMSKIDENQISAERDRIFKIYERKDGKAVSEARKEILTIINLYAGVARNETDLNKGIDELERIKKEVLPFLYISDDKTFRKLVAALEVENLVDVGLMVAKAAAIRKESRGAHYREDYPNRDDTNWLKNVVIKYFAGEMRLETQPVQLTELKP